MSTFDLVPKDALSIGEHLKNAQKLTEEQVALVAARQAESGRRFGEIAVEMGFIDQEAVMWALSQQFHYPFPLKSQQTFSDELVVARDPFGSAAELIRDLRSHLMMEFGSNSALRKHIAVLSVDRGDGKSFLAANLAASLSQLNIRTLIVDADLRAPRIHQLFGIDGRYGLSDSMRTNASDVKVYPVAGLNDLFVLPAGTVPPNPLELIQGRTFDQVLDEVSRKFDYVIIDTPAAVHGADSRVIASKSAASMVVARPGQTGRPAFESYVASLRRLPTKLLGVVLNQA